MLPSTFNIAPLFYRDYDKPNIICRNPNIVCHKNAVNANVSAAVAAGGTVQFQWTTWPHNIGPVLTYVANCGGDCKSVRWILPSPK